MRIIIDYDYAPDGETICGIHWFDASSDRLIQSPEDPKYTISPADYIGWLNGDPSRREKAGWHITTQHKGEDSPCTRFDRLVRHAMSPDGCPLIRKALEETKE